MPDGILYINLAHRQDRNISIQSTINNAGLNTGAVPIQRINAVLHKLCGHIGCAESHILALDVAIKNGWKDVMILEDDFVFTQHPDVISKTLMSIEQLKWDVVMLASGHKVVSETKHDFLEKVITCTTSSGYIIRQHYYNVLKNDLCEAVKKMSIELEKHVAKCHANKKPVTKLVYCSALDQHWFPLQKRDTWYLCKPVLGAQNCGYSDINCTIEHQRNLLSVNSDIGSNGKSEIGSNVKINRLGIRSEPIAIPLSDFRPKTSAKSVININQINSRPVFPNARIDSNTNLISRANIDKSLAKSRHLTHI
jgi:glycosyl transferase family 25